MKKNLSPRPQPGPELVRHEALPFDTLASAYDDWFEEQGKLIFAIEVKALQEVLPLLPKPWLEVGVGSGRFAQALGVETGIDPSIKLLEMASSRGVTGFIARGEERFFKEGTFATVFLIVTLCFVDSPLAVLQEAYRILKPRGKIVLGLVLRESPWGQFYQAKKQQGHRFYKHANFYSYQEVVGLLEHAGFAIDKVVSTLFQNPGEAGKMESPQRGFSSDAGFTVIVANKTPGSRRANWAERA
ncbi:MAG: class I SAM-dependent methyltransferase [Dehalococcoidia bacterium]|jgi:SAM-dependent methyltransferase|nr:class I SAM-dependent methyltransferase [Chloroflexota bacterium]MCK4242092.1 class I SAM-dependent methyltransferase [Dehalococcoidia bacterium]